MIAPEEGTSVKVRGPTPREQPSVEILRLNRANLVGKYPIIKESSAMQSTLTDDDRARLFAWGLDQHHRHPARRTERLPGNNPLTVSDSARNYFSYSDVVADARVQDEKARAALTGKSEAQPVRPPEKATLVRIAAVLGAGVVAIGAAYFFYRWWKGAPLKPF